MRIDECMKGAWWPGGGPAAAPRPRGRQGPGLQRLPRGWDPLCENGKLETQTFSVVEVLCSFRYFEVQRVPEAPRGYRSRGAASTGRRGGAAVQVVCGLAGLAGWPGFPWLGLA